MLGISFHRSPVLYLPGKADRLPFLGHMTLHAFIHPCCHHRAEPSHQSLSCPYSSYRFRYSPYFLGRLEHFQFLTETQLLWSWYGHLLFSRSCVGFHKQWIDDRFKPEKESDNEQQQAYEQKFTNLRVLEWLNKMGSDPKKNQCHDSGRRPREPEIHEN